jgi:DNA polymerase (family X)
VWVVGADGLTGHRYKLEHEAKKDLDLSADNARRAAEMGVLISISTDSHGTGELDLLRCGIDQARRAGLEKRGVLNCLPWAKLQRLFRR